MTKTPHTVGIPSPTIPHSAHSTHTRLQDYMRTHTCKSTNTGTGTSTYLYTSSPHLLDHLVFFMEVHHVFEGVQGRQCLEIVFPYGELRCTHPGVFLCRCVRVHVQMHKHGVRMRMRHTHIDNSGSGDVDEWVCRYVWVHACVGVSEGVMRTSALPFSFLYQTDESGTRCDNGGCRSVVTRLKALMSSCVIIVGKADNTASPPSNTYAIIHARVYILLHTCNITQPRTYTHMTV